MNTQARRVRQLSLSLVFIAVLVFGWRYPVFGFFIPLCMLLGIGIGLVRGRKWCDWYCPRGSFYDALVSIVSPRRRIPELLKGMRFRITVLVVLMAVMAFNVARAWPDASTIARSLVILVTATTAIGMALALSVHHRCWCAFCPIGTAVNLIGKRTKTLMIDSALCVECKLCEKACPLQLRPYESKGEGVQPMKDRDCLRCGSCVAVCPKKALSF